MTRMWDTGTILSYAAIAFIVFLIWCFFRETYEHTLDHMLTLAAGIQLGGMIILTAKVYQYKTCEGVSFKMMALMALSLSLRLSSTLTQEGYLPEDATADYMLYQTLEVCAFGLCCYVIYQMKGGAKVTYNEAGDSMPYWWMIAVVSFAAALFTHSDANQHFIFDWFWMTSNYLDAFSMMPQLFMIAQTGRVERWTSHFVAWTIVSRVMLGVFWTLLQMLHSFAEWPFTIGMVTTIVTQLVLSADYMYYFVKTFKSAEMNLDSL